MSLTITQRATGGKRVPEAQVLLDGRVAQAEFVFPFKHQCPCCLAGLTQRQAIAFFGEVDPVRRKKCGKSKKRADSTPVETALAKSVGDPMLTGPPGRRPAVMSDAVSERLARCYTGVLHDVMRAMGLAGFVFPADLRPLFPERVLAGPVFTIEGRVDACADPHETLLAWTGLLSKAKPGHVWVAQPNDREVAHMGELSAETLKNKGVLGCLVDGYIRDVNFLIEMGFQTWSRGYTPRDIVGYWLPTGFDVDIRICDVVVRPGDYLAADRDGALRIPKELVSEIVGEAEVAVATENKVRTAILGGMDPQQAYLQFGKF
jgi:regulator of RNase E activity RraA